MNLLHINSYYTSRILHSNFVKSISKYDIFQTVYVPVGKKSELGKYEIPELNNIKFIYSKCFNSFSRLLWPLKIFLIWIDIKLKINLSNTELIHAHSLMVNGLIAFFIKKKTGIPYIVTIRNSDINFFIKGFILFKPIAEKILINADSIIMLSPAYRDVQLKSSINKCVYRKIFNKIEIVPNGIDDFWLEGIDSVTVKKSNREILFVGEINQNKNIEGLINAYEILNNRGFKTTLNVVGNGPLLKKIKQKNKKINFYGQVQDKTQLREIYRSSDILVVPSFKESFGLVYPEAMSQGLPVIYSKGQGFDGFFEDGYVGYAIDPYNPKDIADKIKLVLNNHSVTSNNAYVEATKFSWTNQAKTILSLYENVIENRIKFPNYLQG